MRGIGTDAAGRARIASSSCESSSRRRATACVLLTKQVESG